MIMTVSPINPINMYSRATTYQPNKGATIGRQIIRQDNFIKLTSERNNTLNNKFRETTANLPGIGQLVNTTR